MPSTFHWGNRLIQCLNHTLRFINRPPQSRRSRRRCVAFSKYAAEVLEQRRLLTITVTPDFGPTTVLWNQFDQSVPGQVGNIGYPVSGHTEYALNGPMALGTNNFALQSPTIYLIYWGADWTKPGTTTPIDSVPASIGEIKTMISPQSGFLNTVAEYGSNGKVTFGGAWIDNAVDVKAGGQASVNELNAIFNGQRTKNLNSVTGSGALPLPTINSNSVNSAPLYVIIRNTTTSVTKDAYAGKNYLISVPFTDPKTHNVVNVDVNTVQLEVGSAADTINEVLSHELQERIVAGDNGGKNADRDGSGNDSVLFLPSKEQAGWLLQEGSLIQICDGEPDGGAGYYAFPLSGPGSPTVQAAWSVAKQAYVVADQDTAHNYVLTPRWNTHGAPAIDANGNLVNNASTDQFKYDLALTAQSGESLSIGFDAATQTDVFTWGNGQRQAFHIYDLGAVQITLAGTSNHTITLGNLIGMSTVTVTPTGNATATDLVKIAGQPTVSLLQKTSLTAVVDGGLTQYVAIDVSGRTQNLVALNGGIWSTVLTSVKSFEAGYQQSQGAPMTLLALTQDGVLHVASDARFWGRLQTGVTKFGFDVIPQVKQGSGTNYDLLVTLDSNDTLTPYLDFQREPSMTGIRDFEIGHNLDNSKLTLLTETGYAYLYWGPTNDPLAPGSSLKLASDSQLIWNGFQSTSVLHGPAGAFYLGLDADGTLLRTDGLTGWQVPLTQLRSSKVASWAGGEYAFALSNSGVLKTSVDALNWVNQGTDFASFDVGSLRGSNQLFGLKTNGDFWRSTGSGWQLVASNVKSFQLGDWRGSTYVFYLDNAGTLHASSNGTTFIPQSSNIQSFALGPMNAVDTLFMLDGDGQLLAAASTWVPTNIDHTPPVIATDVQSFEFAKLAGRNKLFVLDGHGVLQSMADGLTWQNEATQVTSFGLGLFSTIGYYPQGTVLSNLKGTTTDYLFVLQSNGVLNRTAGNNWQLVATNVAELQVARWANANYAFYRTSANALFSSRDGIQFVSQGSAIQSFAVTTLNNVDTLVALTSTGVLQVSSGAHWSPLATGVERFETGFYGTMNHLVYQTWTRDLYSSTDGSTKVLIKSQVETFGLLNLEGMGFVMVLTSGNRIQSSSGGPWADIALNTSYIALEIGWWNGKDRFASVDSKGMVNVWGSTTADALSYGPAKSVAFATLNGEHWLLSLGSDATLQKNNGSGWQLVTHGVTSMAVAHWASRDYAFYLDSLGVLATSPDGAIWTNQDTSVSQFAVGMQQGQTFLYDLNLAGVLKQSIGGGWRSVDTGVTSFALHPWAGGNYAFYVTSNNLLRTSPDGQIWTNQATDTQSIAIETLLGVDTLFALSTTGILRHSTGAGWIVPISGVRTLKSGHFAGANMVFYLTTSGELFSTSTGTKWNDQGGAYSTFELATLHGQDYLFALRTDHTLLKSVGSGWLRVATNVKQLFQTRSSGVPVIEYVTFDRKSFSTIDGVIWSPV